MICVCVCVRVLLTYTLLNYTIMLLDFKIVYKRYASLYFVMGIDSDDNELITLEVIHRLVEALDRFYGNVCELDLIFNFEEAYAVIDEIIGGHGAVMEMGLRTAVDCIRDYSDSNIIN